MSLLLKASVLALGILPSHSLAAPSQGKHAFEPNAQQLLDESMSWMDTFYDPAAAYLYDESAATALRHETRSSVWYALGLLARNDQDDAHQAARIITNVIGGQFKDPAEQWSVNTIITRSST